jgi:hypothetical protein
MHLPFRMQDRLDLEGSFIRAEDRRYPPLISLFAPT